MINVVKNHYAQDVQRVMQSVLTTLFLWRRIKRGFYIR